MLYFVGNKTHRRWYPVYVKRMFHLPKCLGHFRDITVAQYWCDHRNTIVRLYSELEK